MRCLMSVLSLFVLAALARGDDPAKDPPKKDAGPLELKIVLKKTEYKFDSGGKTPAEYRKMLEQMREEIKEGKFRGRAPNPPAIEGVLQITNTGKSEWVAFVGGDANTLTLNLKGPGVIDLSPQLAFTADFRLSKEVRLEAGKSHEIPLKQLSDGFRSASRYVYWTAPGEYTLTASYQLANPEGAKGQLLTSPAVKLKVVE